MRKIIFLLFAALSCSLLPAQTLSEGFEGETFPPEGWEVSNGNAYGWRKGVKNGQNCALVAMSSYGGDNYLVTPQLKPANGEALVFNTRIGENTGSGELRVEVSLNGTDASSFQLLETYYCSSKKGDAAHRIHTQDWNEFTVDLSAYKNQRIYIAFHATGEIGNGGLAVDNVHGVTLAGDAACENPTNVSLTDITGTTATLTWQGTAAQFQYVLAAGGAEPDWTNAVLTSDKNVTLTGLEEETSYDFYVRSYCSAEAQSLAPKVSIKTTCPLQAVPWLETFTRDNTGSDTRIAEPECWTIASSVRQVSVVADKTYSEEGEAIVVGQAHLQAIGGGPAAEQVFALPPFDAKLDTLEIAFDYKTSLTTDACGVLEIGYMTNPSKASTFVSLRNLPRVSDYTRVIVSLEDLPATAKFIAFRFAGGTSDLCSVSMDNFVVAGIGHSGEVDPSQEDVPDAAIYDINYAVASFTWYSYTAEAFGIGLFDANTHERVAGIVVTNSECERFAYEDSVMFSQYDDYENKYYCSTKWILSAEGASKGEAWTTSVINIGTSSSPILGLKPGQYEVLVYAYTQGESSLGELLATIPFELVSKEVAGLQAVVSDDLSKVTLSWTEPALAAGERLYVSVRAGERVAYDNFTSKEAVSSPFEVAVEEGKTYMASIQILDRKNNPLGHEISVSFTVGTNNYEPVNPTATVENGDVATFTWSATAQADAYVIVLYLEGEFYTSMDVIGSTTKTTYMPADGTWSWTVQALEKGANNKYFPASSEVAGNDFTVQIPDIPSGAIEANPWEMQAAYYPTPADDPDYRAGKYVWFINLLCGANGSAYPAVSAIVYTDKMYGISGTYSTALNNVYYGEDLTFMAVTNSGSSIQRKTASSLEMTLSFEGYDQEHFDEGYRFGRYSGKYVLRTEDGETYAGRFQDIFCNSFNAEYLLDDTGTVQQEHVGMWDENPDAAQAIESIVVPTDKAQKILRDGQLYIVRPDGAIYNATGVRVR